MSSSYFNIRKGLEDFIPKSGYDFSSSPNVFGMDIGNMTSFGTTLGTPKQGNWFERVGNFLSSKDEQVLGEDGRVIPTSTALPTWGINAVFKNKQQVGNVFKDPLTLFTNADPSVKVVKKTSGSNSKGKNTTGSVDDGVLTEHEEKLAINAAEHQHNLDLQKKYLEETGTQLKDLSQFQFLLGQMSKLPDRMSLGNMMRADAYKNQGDRSVTSNIGLMNNMGLPGGLAQFSYDFQRFG